MILHIASDGSYLSETKSRSRVGGIFYLSSKLPKHNQAPDFNHSSNAPFHVVSRILKMITRLVMETEVAATFYNAKEALPFRVTLTEMGHPQPPTPMEVYNETSIGFLQGTMKKIAARPLIWDFTGSETGSTRTNSWSTGDQVQIMLETVSLNTIPLLIINQCAQNKFKPHSEKSFLSLYRKCQQRLSLCLQGGGLYSH